MSKYFCGDPIGMKSTKLAAIFVMVIAVLMTGLGGSLDILKKGTITRKHAWNDGLFLAILAVFLLLL